MINGCEIEDILLKHFQDKYDDGEEMTSERLMALEIKKKQDKEAQIQNMKDREEAACSVICRGKKNTNSTSHLDKEKR